MFKRQAKLLKNTSVSEEALFSHETGRHFTLNLARYCPFHDVVIDLKVDKIIENFAQNIFNRFCTVI